MSNARNLARLVVDNSGALAAANLANAPNPILPGTVAYLGMNTAPTGWLKANGALVSRSTYASLFAAIGTTYGAGDGSTTFALPDLRGEFPRGWDDGRGVDSGRAFGSAQDESIQKHKHETTVGDYATTSTWRFGNDAPWGKGSTVLSTHARSEATSRANRTGGSYTNPDYVYDGGGETRPRNISLLACIKF